MDDKNDNLRNAYQGKAVCVTGGAGFIGSHLVDGLVELGADVRVIDDLSNGREENITHHGNSIRFVKDSILNEAALAEAINGCEIVFHEAALGSVPHSVEEPILFNQVNGVGTVRVLEQARNAGVKRVVYAGSSSAYGESKVLPKIESMLPEPISPYAVSKLMGEYWLMAYASCYGLSCVTLRYFNVFGPRQRPDSQYAAVVPAFINALVNNNKPKVYGDGLQSRDFTFIANVVHANLLAGVCDKKLSGETINIACGEAYTLLDLLELIAELLKKELNFELLSVRTGDVKHSLADIKQAIDLLGYNTIVDFKDGLQKTVDAFCAKV